jgi:hypothetical protein
MTGILPHLKVDGITMGLMLVQVIFMEHFEQEALRTAQQKLTH